MEARMPMNRVTHIYWPRRTICNLPFDKMSSLFVLRNHRWSRNRQPDSHTWTACSGSCPWKPQTCYRTVEGCPCTNDKGKMRNSRIHSCFVVGMRQPRSWGGFRPVLLPGSQSAKLKINASYCEIFWGKRFRRMSMTIDIYNCNK
jgi:hypothetical protein